MKIRPLTCADFYKTGHAFQYPENTQEVYSNWTSRAIKYMATTEYNDNKIVVFGLQYFIKDFLIEAFNKEFFSKPKEEVIGYYKRRLDNALGKDAVSMKHIEELHDLGYLPISIMALPEGTVIDARIPHFTIRNTHPSAYWVTNYLETVLSCMLWKSSNSATIARKYRQLLDYFAKETGADLGFVQFQGHDFSYRGMSGHEDAVMSGAGHLLSFVGTDTIPAIDFIEDYYNGNSDQELLGCSVPATEHSVMCAGSQDGEFATFVRLIKEVYPKGIVSIVSDTWDYWQVVTFFLDKLKHEILAREGKVVIRPDSGDPVKIITGYVWTDYDFDMVSPAAAENFHSAGIEAVRLKNGDYYSLETLDLSKSGLAYKLTEAEVKGSIECMWDIFGGTVTDKGFKVLDQHIGLIYGDSITLERAKLICERLKAKGFASTNVVLGIGSFTYEYNTRDTLGFAMKATACKIDNIECLISKSPKTDSGMKKSALGYLAVTKSETPVVAIAAGGSKVPTGEKIVNYRLVDGLTADGAQTYRGNELVEVFRDGKLLVDYKFSDIRARIAESLK